MAFTSPKMSLRIWNLLSDPFDHDQLADNWSKVDQHDHTPGRGVQITTEGIADGSIINTKLGPLSVGTAQLADLGVTTGKINDLGVTTGKLADGAVTSAKLDSTAFSQYRNLITRSYRFDAGTGGGVYVFFGAGSSDFGTGVAPSGATAPIGFFYLNPADYAMTGKVVNYRVRATAICNGTAAGASFTASPALYPVNTPTTLGAALGQVSFSNIAASSMNVQASADFAAPAAGFYALGMGVGGTSAASSQVSISATLQVRLT